MAQSQLKLGELEPFMTCICKPRPILPHRYGKKLLKF